MDGYDICRQMPREGAVNSDNKCNQGEIVNILLKIKNSFLPTKQILIGL